MGKIAIKTNATADISSILPEVLRFYDATATSTIARASGTNNITSWGDRSVNNIAATQTALNEQPIYDSINKTINMSPIRNFLINFGTNAFNGTVYIADAVHGVLDFSISVGANTILNVWDNSIVTSSPNNFLNIIGIVITSNPNHRIVIENYFGTKSQNLKYSNINGSFSYFFCSLQSSSIASRITSFPLINTINATSMQGTWSSLGVLTSFPPINTINTVIFNQAWVNCFALTFFPAIDTRNATSIQQIWYNCHTLNSVPVINTIKVTNFSYMCEGCSALTSFPAIDTRSGTNFLQSFTSCVVLSPLSLDNILISIAAGFANNINKTITNISNIFSNVPAILTHENRRPTTNNPEDTQDTISNWNTIIDSYLSGGITLTQMRDQHAAAINNSYNIKWKSWEQALTNTNESLNGVQYNFSNGTVSGQKAYYWILAKKSLTIPLGAAPTTLTTGVTRSYRSSSNLTLSGSNVSAWTPVTGTSNQTIFGLTTQTINGITCVMFSSNTKTITLNSINVGTGHRVYIGTLYGYVKITPPTATNLRISTNSTTELPIISIMVTTTAVNETEVLLRLGYYGSFQEFNYTANGLTSNNIQLTAV